MADYYYCRRLDYCQGFDQAREWTVAAWKAAQGFDQYDAWRGDWLEMLLRQGERGPGAVQLQDLFYLSLYDQDNFRQFVFDSAFLRVHDLEPEDAAHLQADELQFLNFSQRYVKLNLFIADPHRLADAVRAAAREGGHG
jgi:hypothetical protein